MKVVEAKCNERVYYSSPPDKGLSSWRMAFKDHNTIEIPDAVVEMYRKKAVSTADGGTLHYPHEEFTGLVKRCQALEEANRDLTARNHKLLGLKAEALLKGEK